MERMHATAVHRAAGGHQGLRGDLAPKDALSLLVGLNAPKNIDLYGLEVEQRDEEIQSARHEATCTGQGGSVTHFSLGAVP